MANPTSLLCFLVCAFWVVGVINGSESKPEIGIYELKTGNFSAKFTNFGARIVSLVLPDKNGKLDDVVLGYGTAEEYLNDFTYFGATSGRVAQRIGGAQFTLNGTLYKLEANEFGRNNTIHGGSKGFGRVLWKVKKYHNLGHSPYITFGYHSVDGDQGFPGDLLTTVTYKLSKLNLAVEMKAKALNKATPVNLAHHSYFNLGGHNSGDILSNEIQIFGSHITPVNTNQIPTGEIRPVKGTPYDLLEPASIASKMKKLPEGYDINYALDGGASKKMETAAIVYDKKSGRVMEVWTNKPGLQFYTGNYMPDVKGKEGFTYQAHAGLCLEAQGFPDSVNHPSFPSQIVTAGKTYVHRMMFKFSTKE